MSETGRFRYNGRMIDASALLGADVSEDAALRTLGEVAIPPCPEIVVELLEETRHAEVDFIRLSRLVMGDVGLAAAVLRMANSPFFALRRKVQSAQQAVAVLGLRNLLKIVYGVVLKQSLGGNDALAMLRFWDRSNFNAVVCAWFAGRLPGLSADDAYTFGLFHDAGIAVMMQRYPDYKQTLLLANAAHTDVTAPEDARYHTNHVLVGAMMANTWYLPEAVVWAIRYHHDLSILAAPRERATPEVCRLVAIRAISEHMVARFLNYPDDAEWDEIREAALSHLGWFEDDLDDLRREMEPLLQETRSYRG